MKHFSILAFPYNYLTSPSLSFLWAETHEIAEDHQVTGQGEQSVARDAVEQRDPRHRNGSVSTEKDLEMVHVPVILGLKTRPGKHTKSY